MKKTAIAIAVTMAVAVAVAGFTTVAQAAPKDNTWYAGGKLGWSQFHDSSWYDQLINNDGSTHKNQLGIGSFGGYQVNPYVGFEIGYDWLGRILYKGESVNGAFKAQGVQLTAKLDYQATNDLDVYTRLGGIIWRADSYNNVYGYDRDFGVSPVLAGGLEWAITRDIATRLEYQWINNIGKGNTVGVRPDNNVLSVGLSYRFSQQKKENQIITASTLDTKVNTNDFTLKSDVLFDFDQSTLKPQDQQVLNKFHNQLINMDLKEGTILVKGFTDHIGSDSYNQSLSEKRANYVANYLASKGLHMVKISAHGMGKSHSVTGNNCNNKKVRSTLISCLAPDRRVEIEFKGIKNFAIKPAV